MMPFVHFLGSDGVMLRKNSLHEARKVNKRNKTNSAMEEHWIPTGRMWGGVIMVMTFLFQRNESQMNGMMMAMTLLYQCHGSQMDGMLMDVTLLHQCYGSLMDGQMMDI